MNGFIGITHVTLRTSRPWLNQFLLLLAGFQKTPFTQKEINLYFSSGKVWFANLINLSAKTLGVSLGQTDRQVVASGRKLNLRRDLCWVAKHNGKFPHKYTQVAKTHFKSEISCISLANNRLMDVTQLVLTWVGWPNGEKPALTYVQIWSRPK